VSSKQNLLLNEHDNGSLKDTISSSCEDEVLESKEDEKELKEKILSGAEPDNEINCSSLELFL